MQRIWELAQGENGDGKEQMCEGADAPELQACKSMARAARQRSDELNKSLRTQLAALRHDI